MATNDYLTINGVVYSCFFGGETGTTSATISDVAIDSCTAFVRGGIPEMHFSRYLGKLTTLPDPWSAQQVAWSQGSNHSTATTYWTGDVVGYTDRYDQAIGWVRDYRALGLRNRADWIPVTDSNTLSDCASYNLPAWSDPKAILSRCGRTVGQCVLSVLSQSTNSTPLSAAGIGNYNSAGIQGEIVFTLSGSTVGGYNIVNPGSGYTSAPTVGIFGGGGYGATATCSVSSGCITGVTITAAGSGYSTPPVAVVSPLPLVTVNDLVSLSLIPPFPVRFAGERILQSVESAVQQCYPNHYLHVVGDTQGADVVGTIRIIDQRQAANNLITLNSPNTLADGTAGPRWSMPGLHRDTSDCYSQLTVRGGLQVRGVNLQVNTSAYSTYWPPSGGLTNNGGILPDFAGWSGITSNATAESTWSSTSDWATFNLTSGQDSGTCVCQSTTQVLITSSNGSLTLRADQLDWTDTGEHAQIILQAPIAGLGSAIFVARVVANTAMTAGGTSLLTLDQAIPTTTYSTYIMYSLTIAGNVVWRRYKVTDPTHGATLQNSFPFGWAYSAPGVAAITYAPTMGVTDGPTDTIACAVDPESGTVVAIEPTSLVFGGGTVTPPSNVSVLVPMATGALTTTIPPSSYSGTSYLIEGIQRTKTITVRDWTDYSLSTNMQQYAMEAFWSICDAVWEGQATYAGLAVNYLTPGQGLSFAGYGGYTTGYEGGGIAYPQIAVAGSGYGSAPTLTVNRGAGDTTGTGGTLGCAVSGGQIVSVWITARGSLYTKQPTVTVGSGSAVITLQLETIPVAQCDIKFNPGAGGTSYVTNLHLSSRRAKYTTEVFIRPPERGLQLGNTQGFGAGYAQRALAATQSMRESGTGGAFGESVDAAMAAQESDAQFSGPQAQRDRQRNAQQTKQHENRRIRESSQQGHRAERLKDQREKAELARLNRDPAVTRATRESIAEMDQQSAAPSDDPEEVAARDRSAPEQGGG